MCQYRVSVASMWGLSTLVAP